MCCEKTVSCLAKTSIKPTHSLYFHQFQNAESRKPKAAAFQKAASGFTRLVSFLLFGSMAFFRSSTKHSLAICYVLLTMFSADGEEYRAAPSYVVTCSSVN